MAIKIIDGVPGSGKTYFVVNHLVQTYKEKITDLCIVTNIDSLIIPHIDLLELIEKKGLEKVFNVAFFQDLVEKNQGKQIILIVDEAQRWFHKKLYNPDVFFFFQYHRHLGLDVYLITQSEKILPLQIISMAEHIVHAQPRSVSLFGEFKYMTKIAGENVDRQVIKPDQKVFDLYKSMTKKEGEKPKRVFVKYVYGMAAVSLIVALVFYFYFMAPNKKKTEQAKKLSSPTVSSSVKPKVPSIHVEDENTKAVQLGYATLNMDLLLEEPITNTMILARSYPYPYRIQKIGKFLNVVGYIPRQKYDETISSRKAEAEGERVKYERASAKPYGPTGKHESGQGG